ncbi:MAG: AAA family ATPase [Gammaproteobacteria bacterium]
MLKSISIKNFTVFGDDFPLLKFSPGLNIIIGENATGKSHLMKLGYALAFGSVQAKTAPRQSKDEMGRIVGDKLLGVFGTDKLGRLVSRRPGRSRCEITIAMGQQPCDFSLAFSTNSQIAQITKLPQNYLSKKPVYFPTREMLSPYPGFVGACEENVLHFDDTYVDLAKALGHAQTQGRRKEKAQKLMDPLEEAMQAKIIQKNDRFYLRHQQKSKGDLEIEFEAEGHRKLAMLTYLIANGQLDQAGSTLFWDEPETNMNARMIRVLAQAIINLSGMGVQVMIATHSLFLLRELDMLNMKKSRKENMKVIALVRNEETGEVKAATCENDIDEIDLDYFVVLKEEAEQGMKYIDRQTEDE